VAHVATSAADPAPTSAAHGPEVPAAQEVQVDPAAAGRIGAVPVDPAAKVARAAAQEAAPAAATAVPAQARISAAANRSRTRCRRASPWISSRIRQVSIP
jgi:hypothetical protein